MDKCIAEINALHDKYPKEQYNAPDFFTRLAKDIRNTQFLSQLECAEIVSNAIDHAQSWDLDLSEVKNHINNKDSAFILSVFNASYFPRLGFDGAFYQRLPVDDVLHHRYQTQVRPVNLIKASKGFMARTVVALFPENHMNGMQYADDSIFYFINKFVDRFFLVTQKVLQNTIGDDFLNEISAMTQPEVEAASVSWVYLHEYHHRQGHMPIPKYLHAKSLKPLAGLEELRVDINAMLTCLTDDALNRETYQKVFKFILAERLFRYSVEGAEKPNYDAIASQLLFNYLIQHKGLRLTQGKIYFEPLLISNLEAFAAEIDAIERGISNQTEAVIQETLLNFIHRYVTFCDETKVYSHHDYFKSIKMQLGV
jgi:hypothetical protein